MNGPATSSPVTYLYTSGTLVEVEATSADVDGPVLAADSWLVSEGSVAAIDVHASRFALAVAAADLGTPEADVHLFWTSVVDLLPREGAWFPRVDLRATASGARFVLTVRPAPERSRSVTVVTHSGADPRHEPTIKGPDLARLATARAGGFERGAQEIALVSPEGLLVEGGYSSFLWWRGETLCVPPADLDRIASVTEASVLALAAALGVEVIHDPATPADLDGLEIWVVNALHGIRIVTAWVDGPSPAEAPGRLSLWVGRLGRLSRPLDTVSA